MMFVYVMCEGNFKHSTVARRKDTHEELDEIQTERARYLLNNDALIEMHS